MSFLKIGDRAAGAIKSAAHPPCREEVVVDADHRISRPISTGR